MQVPSSPPKKGDAMRDIQPIKSEVIVRNLSIFEGTKDRIYEWFLQTYDRPGESPDEVISTGLFSTKKDAVEDFEAFARRNDITNYRIFKGQR